MSTMYLGHIFFISLVFFLLSQLAYTHPTTCFLIFKICNVLYPLLLLIGQHKGVVTSAEAWGIYHLPEKHDLPSLPSISCQRLLSWGGVTCTTPAPNPMEFPLSSQQN